jgi:DNA topoisomerase II
LQQRAEKEAELVVLLKRAILDMWTEELDELLVRWEVLAHRPFSCNVVLSSSLQRDCAEWTRQYDDEKPVRKRKQATLKTRKSLANDDDDSADDFKPSKAAAKQRKKAAAPMAKRPAATAAKIEDSDGEARVLPATKTKRPATTKPPTVKPDPDIEMLDESSTKKKGKAKVASKRKRCVLDISQHIHLMLFAATVSILKLTRRINQQPRGPRLEMVKLLSRTFSIKQDPARQSQGLSRMLRH